MEILFRIKSLIYHHTDTGPFLMLSTETASSTKTLSSCIRHRVLLTYDNFFSLKWRRIRDAWEVLPNQKKILEMRQGVAPLLVGNSGGSWKQDASVLIEDGMLVEIIILDSRSIILDLEAIWDNHSGLFPVMFVRLIVMLLWIKNRAQTHIQQHNSNFVLLRNQENELILFAFNVLIFLT